MTPCPECPWVGTDFCWDECTFDRELEESLADEAADEDAAVGTVDGRPMNPDLRAAFQREGLLPATPPVYVCCLCLRNPVAAQDGFDTCAECLARQ